MELVFVSVVDYHTSAEDIIDRILVFQNHSWEEVKGLYSDWTQLMELPDFSYGPLDMATLDREQGIVPPYRSVLFLMEGFDDDSSEDGLFDLAEKK